MLDEPDVSLSDWKKFCEHCSPFLVSQIFNRGAGDIRWSTIPRARGVAVASDYFLRLANYKAPKFMGHGYKTGYVENAGPYAVEIRSILDRDLWIIERCDRFAVNCSKERLVIPFGWTPFVTRHFKAALCCGRNASVGNIPGLRWAPIY